MQRNISGALHCPTCNRDEDQLISYPDDDETNTTALVVWCPCGTIYVYDETAAPRGIPVYSFSEHEKL